MPWQGGGGGMFKLLFDWYIHVIGHFRILGIGLELACNGGSCGGISLKRDECNLHLKRLPRNSLTCKLVPVQYREYKNGLYNAYIRLENPFFLLLFFNYS